MSWRTAATDERKRPNLFHTFRFSEQNVYKGQKRTYNINHLSVQFKYLNVLLILKPLSSKIHFSPQKIRPQSIVQRVEQSASEPWVKIGSPAAHKSPMSINDLIMKHILLSSIYQLGAALPPAPSQLLIWSKYQLIWNEYWTEHLGCYNIVRLSISSLLEF